jgi:hypothetical protein
MFHRGQHIGAMLTPRTGTVHIENADPTQHPRIDPGYFRNAADAKIMAQGIEWMDKIANHPVLKKSLGDRVLPPQGASLETEEERVEYVRNHISVRIPMRIDAWL